MVFVCGVVTCVIAVVLGAGLVGFKIVQLLEKMPNIELTLIDQREYFENTIGVHMVASFCFCCGARVCDDVFCVSVRVDVYGVY